MFWFTLLFVPQAHAGRKCYALAIEGGGSHGAYEAGVIHGLVNNVPDSEVQWDYISGVSTGSCNTVFASQFKVGDEKNMADYMVDSWESIEGDSTIFKKWNWFPSTWLTMEPGLVNNEPLKEFLHSKASNPIQRGVSCGSTNINEGIFEVFNETIGISNFVQAAVCSSAVWGVFPHQNVFGGVYADGGEIYNIDVFSPLNRCLDDVKNESDVIVDMLLDFNIVDYNVDVDDLDTQKVMEAAKTVKKVDGHLQYVLDAESSYPDVTFRYIVAPSQNLGFAMNFDPDVIKNLIEIGKSDALDAIKYGTNIELIREYARNRDDIVYAE